MLVVLRIFVKTLQKTSQSDRPYLESINAVFVLVTKHKYANNYKFSTAN
jgi:nicotinamide riboside transporter PnuC